MPLTLVLGPANSAKAGEVMGEYAAAAARGAVLVVPNAVDAHYYTRELAAQGSVLGSVLTFAGLADEVAARAGYAARRLTPLQRERVLRRVVRVPLQALTDAAAAAGFPTATGGLIAELERSLVSPQRFADALGAWAAEDERRAPYARDLASLYTRYAHELDRLGRVDLELHAWRALDALRAAPGRWGSEPVFFYGFDDLHPLERDAVETLSRVVGVQVTVSLTYEPARAALEARAEVVEEMRPLAQRVIELPAVDEHYAAGSRAALHHLERKLFEPDAERIDPGSAVSLLEAGGERGEAELVAAELLNLLRDGVPAEEIAVVYRSRSRAEPIVSGVFEQYGIAAAIERRVPFAHTALGRAVLALARCAGLGEGFPRATDLVTYLRFPGLLERPEAIDALEQSVRCEGLTSLAQARERLGFALDEIESLQDAADQGAELARQARRLLSAPSRGQAPVLGPEEQLDARALSAMLHALAELDEVGERASGAELVELLEGLEMVDSPPARPGAVLVTEPLAIRARRFRAVFICGLQEGEFPRPGAAEPFLGDELRRELAAYSGLCLPRREDALASERYLLYAAASRATDRVFLSYRSSDEEGNIALASPFISDVEELFVEGWSERRRRRLLADVVWRAQEAPTARELARSRARASAPVTDGPASPMVSLTERALSHVRHREVVSAGALEIYCACPVRWLIERQLQPSRLEPQAEPLVRGSYMHEALEAVLRRLDAPVTGATLARALELLEPTLAELAPQIMPGRPEGIRAAELRRIEADLRRYLEHEAGEGSEWQPRALELRFGFADDEQEGGREASLPPLELDGVQVRGAIDRVDADPSGELAIVRDYKSGGARNEYQGARWRVDGQLQVALYMLAVRQLLELDPVAGIYQPLSGGDLRARGVFLEDVPLADQLVPTDMRAPEELEAELEDAAERAKGLAAKLRAGDIAPCPETCSREGCRYPGICRSV